MIDGEKMSFKRTAEVSAGQIRAVLCTLLTPLCYSHKQLCTVCCPSLTAAACTRHMQKKAATQIACHLQTGIWPLQILLPFSFFPSPILSSLHCLCVLSAACLQASDSKQRHNHSQAIPHLTSLHRALWKSFPLSRSDTRALNHISAIWEVVAVFQTSSQLWAMCHSRTHTEFPLKGLPW